MKEKKYFEMWNDKSKCPVCNYALTKKHEGMVCTHFGCPLYFKLEQGWVYLDGQKKNNSEFFRARYNFDMERLENKKRWLELKSKLIYEKKVCEICGSNRDLEAHHILPKSSYPELTLDYENLMLICLECHFKLHENDKHRYPKKY